MHSFVGHLRRRCNVRDPRCRRLSARPCTGPAAPLHVAGTISRSNHGDCRRDHAANVSSHRVGYPSGKRRPGREPRRRPSCPRRGPPISGLSSTRPGVGFAQAIRRAESRACRVNSPLCRPSSRPWTRPLSIVPMFLNWNDPITVTELDQVIATGGIPMITWNCGAKDSNVIAGRDDRQIDSLAAKLALFRLPVFLRWFPDPNSNIIRHRMSGERWCTRGTWRRIRHIHDRLVADGASNVTYVWSVDTTTPQADRRGARSIRGHPTWTGSALTVTPRQGRHRLSRTTSAPGTRSSPPRSP